MGFAKGNTVWKGSHKARAENEKARLDTFFCIAADGGADKYADMLDKLSRGGHIGNPELEFMDRYEKLFEYMKPKLARTDLTNNGGAFKPIETVNIEIVNSKDDSSKD